MKRFAAIRRFWILSPILVTLALWVGAKSSLGWAGTWHQWVGQVTALLALDLFAIALLIAARNRTLERMYGGLDKSYRLHGQIAKAGFYLMLVHPVMLVPTLMDRGYPWWSLFVPVGPWPDGYEIARALGVAGYYLFILLVALTLWRRVDYQHWLASHKLIGLAFIAGAAHAFLADSDLKNFAPLRAWLTFVTFAGVAAWIYKTFLYKWAAEQYAYRVERLTQMGAGICELVLKPVGRRMNYEPGEFAFISVRGHAEIPPEPHPFSISSDSGKSRLRFSFLQVGDFTKKLAKVKEGDHVQVYGPYGEFTSYMLDEYKRQVWVGGGIGVTPFLAMLAHECRSDEPKQITFYYSVREDPQLVYDGEVRSRMETAPEGIRYVPHVSAKEGFLSAKRFQEDLGSLDDTAFLFCGPPPMMRALKKSLMEAGVPAERIFFEDFAFV